MNERIRELAKESGIIDYTKIFVPEIEKFVELIKQAIYDEIKQELMDDEDIDAELDIEDRCYLRGCNGGIVDALCIVENFGVDIDE